MRGRALQAGLSQALGQGLTKRVGLQNHPGERERERTRHTTATRRLHGGWTSGANGEADNQTRGVVVTKQLWLGGRVTEFGVEEVAAQRSQLTEPLLAGRFA